MTAPPVAPPRSTTPAPTRRRSSTGRARSAAVQRAYARRAQRTGVGPQVREIVDASTTPFVVLVMVLLTVALVATLWLSTAAAGDSYRLQNAQDTARNLAERSEQLSREVAGLETAPELARRARELGMVPAGDPARLVVGPNGAVAVVGEPREATGPPPAPRPAAPPSAAPPPAAPPPAPAPAPAQGTPAPAVSAAPAAQASAPAPQALPTAAVPGGR